MGIFFFLSLLLLLLHALEVQRGYNTLKKDRSDGLGRHLCLIEIKKKTELIFIHINKFCVTHHKKFHTKTASLSILRYLLHILAMALMANGVTTPSILQHRYTKGTLPSLVTEGTSVLIFV